MTDVYLEVGSKRVFACAFDWPGWVRSGRDEAAALEALAAYRSRYVAVTTDAGLRLHGIRRSGCDTLTRLDAARADSKRAHRQAGAGGVDRLRPRRRRVT